MRAYREEAARKSDFERTELNKDKTGVKLDGVAAINPVNGKRDPDLRFRLCSDGLRHRRHHGCSRRTMTATGSLPRSSACAIIEVVSGGEDVQKAAFTAKDETGIMVNSDFLNGLTVKDAIPAMIEWLGEKGIGHAKVQLQAA